MTMTSLVAIVAPRTGKIIENGQSSEIDDRKTFPKGA